MKISLFRAKEEDKKNLCKLDVEIFGNDGFDSPDLWEGLEIFLIYADCVLVGSLAFRHNSDVSESYDAEYPYLSGSLYLVSVGLLPAWRGRGIGNEAMEWLIRYSRDCGFARIVSNARVSNIESVALHRKSGFELIRTIAGYYEDPDEDAVVFEKKLY